MKTTYYVIEHPSKSLRWEVTEKITIPAVTERTSAYETEIISPEKVTEKVVFKTDSVADCYAFVQLMARGLLCE